MKISAAAEKGMTSPLPGESVESGLGAVLLRLAVRGLEWIGHLLEPQVPPESENRPDLSYWRVHGWPF